MKVFKFFIAACMCILLTQCDTAERRQSKAEGLIEERLFETLDNFKSHEMISIQLDTLRDSWLANSKMIELGDAYLVAQANNFQIQSEIEELENRVKSCQQAAVRSLFSGNGAAFWSSAFDCGDIEKQIETQQQQGKDAYIQMQTIGDSLIVNNERLIASNKFTGWLATYKYRYTDPSGEPRIHTEYHVLDPKLTKILYSWDEDDYRKLQMIQSVKEALQRQAGDWTIEMATTEDEEVAE